MNYHNSPVIEQFPDHDILYLRFSSSPVVRTEAVGNYAIVDYAEDGILAGVELLGVSNGIDLRGLPEPERIRESLTVVGDLDSVGLEFESRGSAGRRAWRSRRAAHLHR